MQFSDNNQAIIRPPAESGSFLLLVTRGCSHNKCAFCGAYAQRKFEVRPWEEVRSAIDEESGSDPDIRRVFLADGNTMILKTGDLAPILDYLAEKFPRLQRVSIYANAGDVLSKTDAELKLLKEKKLSIVYMGLESGSQEVLDKAQKGSTAEEMTEAVKRLQDVGIKVSLIVLLGLGGDELSDIHVKESARVINEMQPAMLNFLTLMLVPGTAIHKQAEKGKFRLFDDVEMLRELRGMVEGLELKSSVFRSNHASNYLSLEGRLPKDKDRLLAEINEALEGKNPLRPEYLRGL